ncbi:MAG: glutamine synthetase family protein [Paramuribaculum sp.]|nr:glutamine synthetase family protein [Paramuribaculum sp.]
MTSNIALNKNHLVQTLGKPADSFTKDDIISYVISQDIAMINFMYPAEDGKLKTLNFIINDLQYLDTILSYGERVDGSSLFSHIEAGNSDLYVLPRFRTAFRDPFAEIPTVTMLCSFLDKDGKPVDNSPEYTLQKACSEFTAKTGLYFEAMGELEFYVIAPDDFTFPAKDQRGYHESSPYAKFNEFRTQCMHLIASAGGQIKYGHSEVGNFTLDGNIYEQNEIEFLPVPAQDAADQIAIAKWIIRTLARKSGYNVTFSPKISTGKAGSGMHIHIRLIDKNGKNVMINPATHTLSDNALRAIAGMIKLAPSITAFGNTNPTSYFRLVPHQEAPTSVCWGDRNRSVLIRVPLGWTATTDMCAVINPGSNATILTPDMKQTVEIRSADGSADIYLLLAALAVACRYGWEIPDALQCAADTYVKVNIHAQENAELLSRLTHLPASCEESARCLQEVRHIYEEDNVFSSSLLDSIIKKLSAFEDNNLISRAQTDSALMHQLVDTYFHCG